MALWGVVDGIRNIVGVMWHVNGVVEHGGWCSQCRLGDVARRRHCGGWWTAFAVSFG